MNRILQAALLWLAFILPASATVLVYKGTGVDFIGTDYDASAGEGCYLILDLNAKEMTIIVYGLFLHKRAQSALIDQQPLDDAVPVTGAANRNYEIFVNVMRQTASPGTFGDQAVYFRGLMTNVNIAGSPGSYSVVSHPRSLAGIYRYAALALGTAYIEHNFVLGFDQAETVTSNNSDLGIAAVEANIVGVLKTAGFQQQ